eukprot:CAMPEP_0203953992 /NCGR_PEP_ID=MMETSP0359-20131031/87210_1 /ASSEMBLY_ACC=CAM_ASM_000338 /TAXON_ID=268821 /ORGANISM="Scrippsiella Hangoei, Strain SHTV-5" /LENGTH=133 /DNA_ID=CAMNT_0050887477 /DNA_START=145 /DNA_END=547 /DNA_ORIENTATION=+
MHYLRQVLQAHAVTPKGTGATWKTDQSHEATTNISFRWAVARQKQSPTCENTLKPPQSILDEHGTNNMRVVARCKASFVDAIIQALEHDLVDSVDLRSRLLAVRKIKRQARLCTQLSKDGRIVEKPQDVRRIV